MGDVNGMVVVVGDDALIETGVWEMTSVRKCVSCFCETQQNRRF